MNSETTQSVASGRLEPRTAAVSASPVALALFRVSTPEDWTGLESALIRLESAMGRRRGWLYRHHDLLYLYFPVGDMTAPDGSDTVDPTRLEVAFECVEQLAKTLEGQGGCGTVFTLGKGSADAHQAWCDTLEAARDQLERARGPMRFVSESIVAGLREPARHAYRRTLESQPGFLQLEPPRPPAAPLRRSRSMGVRLRRGWERGVRRAHSIVRWRPILLAIPGLTMFLLAPYLLRLPPSEPQLGPASSIDRLSLERPAGRAPGTTGEAQLERCALPDEPLLRFPHSDSVVPATRTAPEHGGQARWTSGSVEGNAAPPGDEQRPWGQPASKEGGLPRTGGSAVEAAPHSAGGAAGAMSRSDGNPPGATPHDSRTPRTPEGSPVPAAHLDVRSR
jgi:hypothetical protein